MLSSQTTLTESQLVKQVERDAAVFEAALGRVGWLRRLTRWPPASLKRLAADVRRSLDRLSGRVEFGRVQDRRRCIGLLSRVETRLNLACERFPSLRPSAHPATTG